MVLDGHSILRICRWLRWLSKTGSSCDVYFSGKWSHSPLRMNRLQINDSFTGTMVLFRVTQALFKWIPSLNQISRSSEYVVPDISRFLHVTFEIRARLRLLQIFAKIAKSIFRASAAAFAHREHNTTPSIKWILFTNIALWLHYTDLTHGNDTYEIIDVPHFYSFWLRSAWRIICVIWLSPSEWWAWAWYTSLIFTSWPICVWPFI